MADPVKKLSPDTAATSIGLPRPSYFRRLRALFGASSEVETADSATTSPPDLAAAATAAANGRVVSLRGSYAPPSASEPRMKKRTAATEAGIKDVVEAPPTTRAAEGPPDA